MRGPTELKLLWYKVDELVSVLRRTRAFLNCWETCIRYRASLGLFCDNGTGPYNRLIRQNDNTFLRTFARINILLIEILVTLDGLSLSFLLFFSSLPIHQSIALDQKYFDQEQLPKPLNSNRSHLNKFQPNPIINLFSYFMSKKSARCFFKPVPQISFIVRSYLYIFYSIFTVPLNQYCW